MAVDLHTGDTTHNNNNNDDDDDHVLSVSDNNHAYSPLKPSPPHSNHVPMDDNNEDDFITELTHQMTHFMLQEDDHSFDSSHTHNSQLSWDITSSPESTLWSPVSCNRGSSEGSSQEPSPPATPGKFQDSCWKTITTYDVFENNTMKKLNERAISKYNHDYEIESSNKSSNINGLSSFQTLIQEQIRAIEVKQQQHKISGMKQDHVLSPKKGNGRNWAGRRAIRPSPVQTGSGMRAVYLGGSGSRCGTGVFLPGSGTAASSESKSKSTNKQGKGCSAVLIRPDYVSKKTSVLIPARVVQALQLHFDKTAALSQSNPPLNANDDVVSSMYPLENHRFTTTPTDVLNDMILPHEWTY